MSIEKVFAVAENTARSIFRDRKFWFAIVLWLLYIFLIARPLRDISDLEMTRHILKSFISGFRFIAFLAAIFLGTVIVESEVQKRTIQVVLTKPIFKWEFLLGKFFCGGLIIILFYVIFVVTTEFLSFVYGIPFVLEPFWYLLTELLYLLNIFGWTLLLSQIVSPFIAGSMVLIFHPNTFMFWIKGIEEGAGPFHWIIKKIGVFINYITPPYGGRLSFGCSLPFIDYWLTLYQVTYLVAAFLVVCYIFNRREILKK